MIRPILLGLTLLAFGVFFYAVGLVGLRDLGAPGWQIFPAAGALLGFVVAAFLVYLDKATRLGATAAGLWIAIFTGTAGTAVYADHLRRMAFDDLHPDIEVQNSFLASIFQAPRELQFFLHGAAMKDCTPMAWSYADMDFYRLPDNAAVNVLPVEWVEACDISRSN